MKDSVALITGTPSGIGYETAIVLVVNAGSMICRWPVVKAPDELWDEVIGPSGR